MSFCFVLSFYPSTCGSFADIFKNTVSFAAIAKLAPTDVDDQKYKRFKVRKTQPLDSLGAVTFDAAV